MKVVFSMNNAKQIISRRNVAMEDAFAALKCHQLLTKTEPSNAKVRIKQILFINKIKFHLKLIIALALAPYALFLKIISVI